MQEFIYRKLTTHVPKRLARSQPILRDGTPVSLFSVEDLRSATPQSAGPVTFVLAKDMEVGGVIAAKAGTKVVGQVTYTAVPSAAGSVDSKSARRTSRSETRRAKQAPVSWNIVGWKIRAALLWSCMSPGM